MSPRRCTEVEKLLLISSPQLLDSIRDELREGHPGVVVGGGRGTAVLLENDLPAIERL
jgi:hypothetical protein